MNTVWHCSCLLPISISTSVQDVSATAKPGQVPDLQEEVMAGYSEGKFMRKTVDWTVDTAVQTHDGVYTVQQKLQSDTTMVKAQAKVESDPIRPSNPYPPWISLLDRRGRNWECPRRSRPTWHRGNRRIHPGWLG